MKVARKVSYVLFLSCTAETCMVCLNLTVLRGSLTLMTPTVFLLTIQLLLHVAACHYAALAVFALRVTTYVLHIGFNVVQYLAVPTVIKLCSNGNLEQLRSDLGLLCSFFVEGHLHSITISAICIFSVTGVLNSIALHLLVLLVRREDKDLLLDCDRGLQ